jgi:hypothetical protein
VREKKNEKKKCTPTPTHSRLCVLKDSNSVRGKTKKKMKRKKMEKCALLEENASGLLVTH